MLRQPVVADGAMDADELAALTAAGFHEQKSAIHAHKFVRPAGKETHFVVTYEGAWWAMNLRGHASPACGSSAAALAYAELHNWGQP